MFMNTLKIMQNLLQDLLGVYDSFFHIRKHRVHKVCFNKCTFKCMDLVSYYSDINLLYIYRKIPLISPGRMYE